MDFHGIVIVITNVFLTDTTDMYSKMFLKKDVKQKAIIVTLSLLMAINWLFVVNMEISMVKTKVGCYGNQILALQPCGGNPYGA